MKKKQFKVSLSLTPDTAERLKQYAADHHTTMTQAVTDWIWKQKVSESPMKGQMTINEKGEIK
jgi:hypothetical protein